jgi:hypothetical protein
MRLAAGVQGPDMEQIDAAVARLAKALADAEDVRGTSAEDAHQRADLLSKALSHHDRHADEETCPVCGTDGALDADWVARAAAQIAVLRQEAKAADDARSELRSAARAVQDLAYRPQRIPSALTDPWDAWTACRTISDPGELARRARETAAPLADACAVVKESAVKELERRDERWRLFVIRLAPGRKGPGPQRRTHRGSGTSARPVHGSRSCPPSFGSGAWRDSPTIRSRSGRSSAMRATSNSTA